MKPIIYQVFTRLFGNADGACVPFGDKGQNGVARFKDFTVYRLRRIRQLGANHIWFTGVIRHATCTDYSQYGIPTQHPGVVKGQAGSPYAITDYYDVDPDLATDVPNRMKEFEALLARCHREGLRVIIDFVPNHVARQYKSVCKPDGARDLGEGDRIDWHFSPNNNFYYCVGERFAPSFDAKGYEEFPARATGNDCFSACPGKNDWYETVKLNYGIDYCAGGGLKDHFFPRPATWDKMVDILRFWADKGIDGFRCDMAEMVPADFWDYAISRVREQHPQLLFIGEVYNPALYRRYIQAGFTYLYDKVGMYDCLKAVVRGERPAADITRQWQATDDIHEHMLYFLENHDEQRIASPFFAGDARKALPAAAVSTLLKGNPYMHYFGQEFGEAGMDSEGFSGQDGRTTIFDYWTVDSVVRGYFDRKRLTRQETFLEEAYKELLALAKTKLIAMGQTFDLMYVNPQLAQRQYAFLRKMDNDLLLVVCNFSDQPVHAEVNLPEHCFGYLNLPQGEEVEASDCPTFSLEATTAVFTPMQRVVLSSSVPQQIEVGAWGYTCRRFMLPGWDSNHCSL